MALLIAGLLLFTVVHLLPAALPGMRRAIIARLGDNPYRGIYSLFVLAGLVLIVFGWKSSTPTPVYAPPLGGGPIVSLMVFAAFILFAASRVRSNLRRVVRHPQMTAVILWSAAHLMANGDARSLALFGGLGAWAVLEILLCNRRDGAWQKPVPVSRRTDIVAAVIGAAAFGLFFYLHRTLFGVFPG